MGTREVRHEDAGAATPSPHRRPRRTLLVALAVGLLVTTGGLTALARPASRPATTGSDDGRRGSNLTVGFSTFPPGKRLALPPLRGTMLGGQRLALADLRGQVLVVNAWASWCDACRDEAPTLAKAALEWQARGVHFVGIDVKDDASAATAFERRYAMPYHSVSDQQGKLLAQLAGLVPVDAVPSTIFVDRAGNVAATEVGRLDEGRLRDEIADLLDQTQGNLGGRSAGAVAR
ncbi:MAG: TlpA family protein disulfide reductase [Motilibacteraceae bacterium]